MLLNYLITTWRNLRKQKLFSLINLAGLTLGLAVCLLIVVYVQYEQEYDRFNANYATLYRVAQHQNQNGTWYEVGRSPAKLAAALRETFPEVKNATHFRVGHSALLSYGRLTGEETNGLLAEPALFAMFSFPFVQGKAGQALAGPNSIVLTERLARKYFGTANPVGRVMLLDRETPLRVTGVIGDPPAQSHLQFDYVLPLALARTWGVNFEEWGANSFYTYVQLHDPAQRGSADGKLSPFAGRTYGNPSGSTCNRWPTSTFVPASTSTPTSARGATSATSVFSPRWPWPCCCWPASTSSTCLPPGPWSGPKKWACAKPWGPVAASW